MMSYSIMNGGYGQIHCPWEFRHPVANFFNSEVDSIYGFEISSGELSSTHSP
jgi:hypothetical protein